MDDKQFDDLVRLFGRGASRRSILKGLLGLGSSAAVGGAILSESDARTVGTRPSIPTPRPPIPTPTRTPTPSPTATPACAGFRCGLECCDDELKCCDGECCPDGTVCLTRVFDEGPFVQEETCCLEGQTCDNRCCDGTCFTPLSTTATGFARSCCAEADTLCMGTGAFAGMGLCCIGDTPDCCHNADGSPICLTEAQCCTSGECAALSDPAQCLEGVCEETFSCVARSLCLAPELCCGGACRQPDGTPCTLDSDCCSATCATDQIGDQLCCASGKNCVSTDGSVCCESAGAACFSGGCCETAELCNGTFTCCPAGETCTDVVGEELCCASGMGCIAGADRECCESAAAACFFGGCCESGEPCQGNAICCPAGETCTDVVGEELCCASGMGCIAGADRECCESAAAACFFGGCCESGEPCQGNAICCPAGETCTDVVGEELCCASGMGCIAGADRECCESAAAACFFGGCCESGEPCQGNAICCPVGTQCDASGTACA